MSIIGQPVSGLGSWGGPSAAWRFPLVIPVDFSLQVAGEFHGAFKATGNFCQIGNAGLQFKVTFLDSEGQPLNISGATAKKINLLKPDGTMVQKTASYLTNGIDGAIYFVTGANDIDAAGLWYVQGEVTVGGSTLTTALGQFEANANI